MAFILKSDIIQRIEHSLTKELKLIISGSKLVDTGKMFSESRINLKRKNEFEYEVQVISTNYFKYLFKKNKIFEQLINSDAYKQSIKTIAEELSKEELIEIKQMFKQSLKS